MAKRKKNRLPRVTVFAYNGRDLVAFADAVDRIISSQFELERQLAQLKLQVDRLTARASNGRQRKVAAIQNGGEATGVPAEGGPG